MNEKESKENTMPTNTLPRTLSVHSEIGQLDQVLLHRPGRELESLTPQYLDSMLFEDIPYLERMQQEHDQFAQRMRQEGVRVSYVDELLTDILQKGSTRAHLIEQTIAGSEVKDLRIKERLQSYLESLPVKELTTRLIGGVLKQEVPSGDYRDLSYYIRDEYPYYIPPLPNLYFTRDPGTVIGKRVSINTMKTPARRRETMILKAILSSTYEEAQLLDGYSDESSIEGGDILILSKETVAIGCSARTEAWAIEQLAGRILDEGSRQDGFRQVLVIQIPFTRAYMHLDTVFTMVDHDKFTIYPGVLPLLKVFILTRSQDGSIIVRGAEDLQRTLGSVLGLGAVDLIQTGGGDRITAAREQWNDSTNTLALAPGKVVTYRRNVVSNETLTDHGVTVIPIDGSELVRGRGGPRCMSMPLARQPV